VNSIDRKQLQPCEYPGLVRLGLEKDGGYVVPSAQVRQAAVLLSLGVNEDWSFDRAFVALSPAARVVAVDHTVGPAWFMKRTTEGLVDAMAHAVRGDARRTRKPLAVARNAMDYFGFFSPPHRHIAKRVATRDSDAEITIARLLAIAGAGDLGAFVKMDVEGAEYELIPAIIAHQSRINCLVAEFHAACRKPARFNDAVAQLLHHFRIVHIHGNNYGAFDEVNQFPDAVEITFVNSALVPEPPAPSRHAYPRAGLDFPNHPRRPDYPLRFD
jgi:hypothetical protein